MKTYCTDLSEQANGVAEVRIGTVEYRQTDDQLFPAGRAHEIHIERRHEHMEARALARLGNLTDTFKQRRRITA
ncbi:hypothetical protein PSCICN_09360 [Pseudomonas cichorii]|nr:hypothetical protein PSCICN_09360 [Pseudomonas cichorii]